MSGNHLSAFACCLDRVSQNPNALQTAPRRLSTVLADEIAVWAVKRLLRRSAQNSLVQTPMFVTPSDLIGQRVIATGHFELTQFSALDAVLKDAKTLFGFQPDIAGSFLDVGANVGLYTLRYAHCFSECLAIEANPATYHALRANLLLARVQNASAVCIGASDTTGTAQLNVSSAGMLGWSRLGSDASWDTYPVEIRLEPLDVIAASLRANSRIALLKIDVEGHELMVLKGAIEILTKDGPLVLFEALSGKAGNEAAAILKNTGYEDFFTFSRTFNVRGVRTEMPVQCSRVDPTNLSASSLVFAARRRLT